MLCSKCKEMRDISRGITYKKVILVEGQDEINFFQEILKYLEIMDFKVISYDGKDRFHKMWKAYISSSGFGNLESIIIVRDADKSVDSSFESLKNTINSTGFCPPAMKNSFNINGDPKIGVYIMPGNSDNGMLEDLFLKTVSDDPVCKYIDEYIQNVKRIQDNSRNIKKKIGEGFNESKSKSQCYLAAMPKYTPSVGVAACKKYWNFEHDSLDELKSFLRNA